MSHIHTYRTGPETQETKNINAMQAIKAQCLECCNWQRQEVVECSSPLCSLWPFRLGKTGSKRVLTEDQRGALRDRMKALSMTKSSR